MAGKIINHNDYFIEENITTLRITNRKGVVINVLIDTEDLDRIKNHNWCGGWRKGYQNRHYIQYSEYQGTINGKPKYKSILLHKFIMDVWDKRKVDHINHDSLDNTRKNLRVIENKLNLLNRKSKNSNNKSGFRNVSWHERDNRWVVQLQVEGKNTILKRFKKDQLEEAGVYAEEMRQKYYGEYKGES